MFNGTDSAASESTSDSGWSLNSLIGLIGGASALGVTFVCACQCAYKKLTSSKKSQNTKVAKFENGQLVELRTESTRVSEREERDAAASIEMRAEARTSSPSEDSNSSPTTDGLMSQIVKATLNRVGSSHPHDEAKDKGGKGDIEAPDPMTTAFLSLCKQIIDKPNGREIFTNAVLFLSTMKHIPSSKLTAAISILQSLANPAPYEPTPYYNNHNPPVSESRSFDDNSPPHHHNAPTKGHRRAQSSLTESLSPKHKPINNAAIHLTNLRMLKIETNDTAHSLHNRPLIETLDRETPSPFSPTSGDYFELTVPPTPMMGDGPSYSNSPMLHSPIIVAG